MYFTILRMIWPYAERYAANWIATYLRERKERLQETAEEQAERLPAVEEIASPLPEAGGPLGDSATWLTFSGLALIAVVVLAWFRIVMQSPEESQL